MDDDAEFRLHEVLELGDPHGLLLAVIREQRSEEGNDEEEGEHLNTDGPQDRADPGRAAAGMDGVGVVHGQHEAGVCENELGETSVRHMTCKKLVLASCDLEHERAMVHIVCVRLGNHRSVLVFELDG